MELSTIKDSMISEVSRIILKRLEEEPYLRLSNNFDTKLYDFLESELNAQLG